MCWHPPPYDDGVAPSSGIGERPTWSSPASRPLVARWQGARGAVVGLVATTLAVLGHTLASGMSPHLAPTAVLTGLSVPVAVRLSRRRWTLRSLVVVLLAAQGGYHLALSQTAMPAMSAPHPAAGAIVPTDVLMVLAHLVAALVAAVLLGRGEEWCWALWDLVRRPLGLPAVLAVPVLGRPEPTAGWVLPRRVDLAVLAGSLDRRGPPRPGLV